MLKARLTKLLKLDREDRHIIFDKQSIAERVGLLSILDDRGFKLLRYDNVEEFRIVFEEDLKVKSGKIVVIVSRKIYVPYDIMTKFHVTDLTAEMLFPNLNPTVAMRHMLDWDIISFAYQNCYLDYTQAYQTEQYIKNDVFSSVNIEMYCVAKSDELHCISVNAVSYNDWIHVAKLKASIEYYAAMRNLRINLIYTDEMFRKFVYNGYNRLSSEVGKIFPPILTKTLLFIADMNNDKTALIVMDGMSLFDFEVISRYFDRIDYEYNASFALIPTTTPVSRQSLLSGKYPIELTKPFSLVDEEKEFKAKATAMGFSNRQVEYLRGYDANIRPLTKLAVVVVNEVDDIVHGQRQGRAGMYNDMGLLGNSGKLQSLVSRLIREGFAVYITADHGNTQCTGIGNIRVGIEVESRSNRMVILKDFAEVNTFLFENTNEYPGYYLDKDYRYLICKTGISLDINSETVMTHGGISIDEVIVPFIRIKGAR